jgi:hypothetical protein
MGRGPSSTLYIFFQPNTQANALLNWVGTSFGGTIIGSPTFVSNRGFKGAVGAAINTGFIPSTAGGHYSLSSGAIGYYSLTSRTTFGTIAEMGAQAGARTQLAVGWSGGVGFYDINDTSGASGAVANAQGFWITSRTAASGAAAIGFYHNGSATPVATATAASTSLTSEALYSLRE